MCKVPADPRRRRNLALELTAQDTMRVIEFLRRMKHRAEAPQLPITIPAELQFLELMSKCAALKHTPADESAQEHP